ncbi:DoxX family protein [Nonomuraea spiralis]|uniref:DoxX family protein n=1 Tax=Nonomuraea spiralis TaxID=46182 RepID=UPI00379F6C05
MEPDAPHSWLLWPIGTLKAAAAAGLVLYFVCALYTHLRVGDRSPQFFLAIVFLATAVLTPALDPALVVRV